MGVAVLEEVAEKWISLWCTPIDWGLFEELHDASFIDYASARRTNDREGFAAGLKELTLAFPNLKTRIDDLVIDQDQSKVAVRWTAQGTNKLAYLGVGPTLKQTEIRGIEIIEIRSGKIVSRWGEWDISGHGADVSFPNPHTPHK